MSSDNTGVLLKLLKEFSNRKITVETSAGDVFKGVLLECEDNMSIALSGVKATLVDGRSVEMTSVYIKGSRVRLINLPDSAIDSLSSLNRAASRGRGGFRGRGGRGGRGGGGGFRRGGGGGGGKPSYDRRRY